jgi:hypothetical protein
MKNLKIYSKYYKKVQALNEILKDLKPAVLRELKKCPDGQAIVDDVEYHRTIKITKTYPKEVTEAINSLRENADLVSSKETESFDAYIPKSVKDEVLAKSSTDFKKYFSV